MLPSGDTASTIEFIRRVNRSDGLQQEVRSLTPRDWKRLRELAAREGYDVDYESFADACLSPQVNRFCQALSDFAGHLHLYKM
jgi:hypothetical protein